MSTAFFSLLGTFPKRLIRTLSRAPATKTACLFATLACLLLGGCGLFQPDYVACIDKYDTGTGFNSYEVEVSAGDSTPVSVPFYENQSITKEGTVFLGCQRKTVKVLLCDGDNCPTAPPAAANSEEVIVIDKKNAGKYVPSSLSVREGEYNIITNITGYWSVREKFSDNTCLLSAGDNSNECKAKDGRGLFFKIGTGAEEKEITSVYSPGKQTGSVTKGTLSDVDEGAIGFQYKHLKSSETDDNITALPGTEDYQYAGEGYVLHVTVCGPKNLKKDGECMKEEAVVEGGEKLNKLYFSEFEGGQGCNQDGDYSNNYGYYTVKIKGTDKPKVSKFFSSVVTALIEYIYGSDTHQGILPAIFTAFVTDKSVVSIANAALMLAIVFMGYGYMAGITKFNWEKTTKEFFKYVLLVGVVNPEGWDLVRLMIGVFFSDGVIGVISIFTKAFEDTFATILIPASKVDLNVNSIVGYAKETTQSVEATKVQWQSAFAIYDKLLEIFFDGNAQKKLFGLLCTFPLGTVAAAVSYINIILVIYAIFRVLMSIIYAILYSAIIILLFPITLILFVFKKTKRIIDNIINFLILFFLMPIVTLPGTMLVGYIVYATFFSMLSYTACYGCASYLKLPDPFGVICLVKAYYPWGASPGRSMMERITNFPIKIYHMGMFIYVCYFFQQTTEYCERLAHEMSNASHYFPPNEKINISTGKISALPMNTASVGLQGIKNFSSLVTKGAPASPKPPSAPRRAAPPPAYRPTVVPNQVGEARFGGRDD